VWSIAGMIEVLEENPVPNIILSIANTKGTALGKLENYRKVSLL
jgi:hypothetical protein